MNKGTGDPRLPAYDGESMESYLRRLAVFLGEKVAGPPLKPMPTDSWLPYAEPMEPGSDDE